MASPGVCLATSGPGAIHLLNGLYDAKLDHQPVVATVGQQKSMGLGGHYQQEVDLLQAMNAADPINPQRVFWELSPKLPDEVILIADSGSATNWYARDLKVRKGRMASLSGNLATMGCGVPYAIGAKFAFPHRPVIAMVGDGAMQMNGNAELITVARYWKEWKDPSPNPCSSGTWITAASSSSPSRA